MNPAFSSSDALMMRRALQLARNGALHAHPNPMVGAVIATPSGRVIGEGWHRRCGEGHAEVNAVASVAPSDRHLLAQSTIYVTLEPCSHYGKTPPCAKLIIESGIPRVIAATLDPFAKVSGRGVAMLREAGVEVLTGLMEEEARSLNRPFFTAHTLRRPFITLKWAQSADGFIDGRNPGEGPAAISSPVTRAEAHKLRAYHDAILVGSGTLLADAPSLTVRHFAGDSPRRFVASRSGLTVAPDGWQVCGEPSVAELAAALYEQGITSLLVEGGARLLQSFIDAGLYDALHVEVSPSCHLASKAVTVKAPRISLPGEAPIVMDSHLIYIANTH